MMCAVALAGVAYALTQTTVTSNGNSTDYGAFKIDLTTDGSTEVSNPWFSNVPVVDFGRVKVVGNANPTWNVNIHQEIVATAKVKVTAEANHANPNAHSGYTLKGAVTDVAAGVTAVVTFTTEYFDGENWVAIPVAGIENLVYDTAYDVRVVASVVSASVSADVYSAFASAAKTMSVTFTAEIA